MPKLEGSTFCVDCQEPLMFAPLFINEELAMWCNNPKCMRFGLLTVVSTPIGKVYEKDKEDRDKEVE